MGIRFRAPVNVMTATIATATVVAVFSLAAIRICSRTRSMPVTTRQVQVQRAKPPLVEAQARRRPPEVPLLAAFLVMRGTASLT